MKTFIITIFLTWFMSFSYGQTSNYGFALAYKAQVEKNYDEAIRLYSIIIEHDSVPWAAYHNRSICYYDQKMFDLAKKDLLQILNTYPNDTMALYRYGSYEFDQFNWEKSISLLHRAYGHMNQPDHQLLFKLGSAYYFSNQIDSAAVFLEKALILDTINSATVTNLAWVYLEIDPVKSIKYFKTAYQLDTANYIALNNLGYAELLAGNLEVAKAKFLKSMEMNPDNPFVYRNLGLYYMLIDDKKAACKNLRKCLNKKMIETWGEQYITELREFCEKK